jgi:hypothetical protein
MPDSTADLLADATAAQANYAAAELVLADMRALRARAFRACRSAGLTYRAIAAATGLSFQRIRDITDPQPRKPKPRRVDYRDVQL